MEKPANRQWDKRRRALLLALACLAALALVWGLAVEPLLLTVTEIQFTDVRLPEEMDGVLVVFITDLHVGTFLSPADVERTVARVNELNPDLVLYGGDLLQNETSALQLDRDRISKAFAGLSPRLGKYAVYGNHDIRTPACKKIAEIILTGGGFTMLENSASEVAPGFFVAGTASWPMEGEDSPKNFADVAKVAYTTENNAFSLLLSHEPAQERKNAAYPFALQLSGHTHGGQVALPFVGPILLPGGTEIFKSGFYTVENTGMFVSRGVGTSIVRVRFLMPPEIVAITLHKNSDTAQ